MSSKHKEQTREMRKLKDLKPFPLQAEFFDDLSPHDLSQLAADIERNGLLNPIRILPKNAAGYPANTILSGHQRVRALIQNGKTEVLVVVCYDLSDADAATIERTFLEDNHNRRHQDPLAKARVALALLQIERKRKPGEVPRWDDHDARDRVGKALGMSGRHLGRYFRLLRTPVEVQNAFRHRELALVVAEKVADLNARDQESVADRIRAGENAKDVILAYFPKPAAKPKGFSPLERLHRALVEAQAELAPGIDKIETCAFFPLEDLRRGRDLIDAVIGRLEHNEMHFLQGLKQLKNRDEEE
jgi:ParB-like chromosome segregation protein Spo0J